MHRKIFGVQVVVLLLAALCSAQPLLQVSADAKRIDTAIQFPECQLTPFNQTYHQISITGLPTSISPGKPALPFYHFRALLPSGAECQRNRSSRPASDAQRPLSLTTGSGSYPMVYRPPKTAN